MIEENLPGYLLGALDPAEVRSVDEALRQSHPLRQRLARLRAAVAPLDAETDAIEPPADLLERTLALCAREAVRLNGGRAPGVQPTPVTDLLRELTPALALTHTEPIIPSNPYPVSPSDRSEAVSAAAPSRRNVFAAVALAVVVLSVLLPGILVLRGRQELAACQQTMSVLHRALMSHADQFDGRLPKIEEGQTGGQFAQALQRRGLLPAEMSLACPAVLPAGVRDGAAPLLPNDYAYTFGYRDSEGHLVGLRVGADSMQTPVLADAPAAGSMRCRPDAAQFARPVNHRAGQNVLFLGGNVRFCSHVRLAGDDDIFCNQQQQTHAGLHPMDLMLGRADETP